MEKELNCKRTHEYNWAVSYLLLLRAKFHCANNTFAQVSNCSLRHQPNKKCLGVALKSMEDRYTYRNIMQYNSEVVDWTMSKVLNFVFAQVKKTQHSKECTWLKPFLFDILALVFKTYTRSCAHSSILKMSSFT